MPRHRLALLKELLAQPTAPFREHKVVELATRVLQAAAVPFFLDPLGNVVVGADSPRGYARLVRTRTREPLRLYVAHMDHPGFHGVRWRGTRRLHVAWHGGAPVRHLAGAPVWLADSHGGSYRGRLRGVRLALGGRTLGTAEVVLDDAPAAPPPAAALYGGFRFRAPVWQSGRLLYTKAADDLVGVYAVLVTALDLYRRGTRAPFLGLLTRAEEVGFVGAIGHFELGWLTRARRPVLCLSLETSRTLAGAEVGKGPVVRLGDRRTVFAPNAINVLSQLARRTLPDRHQRRIMDGGTCEATAATVYGLDAFGISVPLGNYHNQGLEGGPDCRGKNGPAPEFVNLDDVRGMLRLCREVLRPGLPWGDAWRIERRSFKGRLTDYRPLL
jgi:putative aminopeptidase FrvX